jgi:hypothetical protein
MGEESGSFRSTNKFGIDNENDDEDDWQLFLSDALAVEARRKVLPSSSETPLGAAELEKRRHVLRID